MNCNEARRHWELYYDSEGDSQLYLGINEHLAECPSCAKWFIQQGQFEEQIAQRLSAGEATPELWQRVLAETGVVRPVAVRGWIRTGPVWALAVVLLVALGAWLVISRSANGPRHLSALAAGVHRGLAEEGRRIEFASSSDQEVEQYLKQRVTFSVRCPPRGDAGFMVRGGGICSIAGEPAAYVVGHVENQDISVFILPQERLEKFKHERDMLRRQAIHHCREGAYDMVLARIDRNVVVVIGHGRPEKLEKVVRAYGTYPENPAASGATSGKAAIEPHAA